MGPSAGTPAGPPQRWEPGGRALHARSHPNLPGCPQEGGTHFPGLVHAAQELRELGQDAPGRLQSGAQSGAVTGQLLLPSLEAVGKERVPGTEM